MAAPSIGKDKMQAVQIAAPGQIQFVEIPRPELKPGHALVRPLILSLCGSDVWMLHYAPPENYPFPPGVTGHEMVGAVEAVAAPNSDIRVGDVALIGVKISPYSRNDNRTVN